MCRKVRVRTFASWSALSMSWRRRAYSCLWLLGLGGWKASWSRGWVQWWSGRYAFQGLWLVAWGMVLVQCAQDYHMMRAPSWCRWEALQLPTLGWHGIFLSQGALQTVLLEVGPDKMVNHRHWWLSILKIHRWCLSRGVIVAPHFLVTLASPRSWWTTFMYFLK